MIMEENKSIKLIPVEARIAKYIGSKVFTIGVFLRFLQMEVSRTSTTKPSNNLKGTHLFWHSRRK